MDDISSFKKSLLDCGSLNVNEFIEDVEEWVEIIQFNELENSLDCEVKHIKLGKLICEGSVNMCYRVTLGGNSDFVIKLPKEQKIISNIIDNFTLNDTLLNQFINEYNKMNPPKLILFNRSFLVYFNNREKKVLALCEPYLSGEFIRFNYDGSYINYLVKRNTPHSFIHFSYEHSKKKKIVLNIKGISGNSLDMYNKAEVLDVYSNEDCNSMSSLVKEFLDNHFCNSICRLMNLNDLNGTPNTVVGKMNILGNHFQELSIVPGSLVDDKESNGLVIGMRDDNKEEEVEIIKFSEDGSILEKNISKIKIGMFIDEGALRKCYRLSIDGNDNFVIKIPKYQMNLQDLIEDNLIHETASIFATSFNRFNTTKKIEINKPFIIQFINRNPKSLAQCEPYLNGEFIKFNNNGGYVNQKVQSKNTPQAFSHFTYEYSNSLMIIIDIQGISGKDTDIYTDLQIHNCNSDDSYRKKSIIYKAKGIGNRGENGINDFFQSHSCNEICNLLDLYNHNQPSSVNPKVQVDSDEIDYLIIAFNDKELFKLGMLSYYNNDFDSAIVYFKSSSYLGNENANKQINIIINRN